MSNLESIVPPPELCKQIPAGEFEDSALVWMYRPSLEGISDPPFMADMRVKAEYLKREMYPAPTLDEILEAIGGIETWDTMTLTRITNGKQSLTTNTMKRWFKVKGINLE